MKKFFRRSLLTAVASLGLLVTAACGGGNTSAPADNGGENTESETTEIQYQERPSTIVLGTASQGGAYYIFGGGLGELINSVLGVTTNVEVTGGPADNIRLIQAGAQDLGLITTGPAYDALHGQDTFEGEVNADFRVIFPMYDTPFHYVALKSSGVTSMQDLIDKGVDRIGTGPTGGTSGSYLPLIHKAIGLNATPVAAGAEDMFSQQKDGQLDIIGFAAGIPIPAIQGASVESDLVLFGIDGEIRDQIIEKYPYFTPFTIPAGTYENIDHGDVETVSQYNFGAVHKTMNIDFVYDLVKAYHEKPEKLIAAWPSAANIKPEDILINQTLPMHPGAIKYYEEIGIELPESVYPPEYKK